MTSLSELSIVVLTYNRHRYALRLMRYWSGSPVKVHILDGTKTPISAPDLNNFHKNIEYHHLPVSLRERLVKATEIIDTPFVIFSGDDEFYIPNALEHCVDYLKTHDDYVICAGRSIKFIPTSDGILAEFEVFDRYAEKFTLDSADAATRMKDHMNPYNPYTIYAVQFSEVWKNGMQISAGESKEYSCPYVLEIQFELMSCFQGKAMILDELMWLRSKENPPIDTKGWDRKKFFHEWIRDPAFQEEVDHFYESTASNLAEITGTKKTTVVPALKQAVDAYLDYCEIIFNPLKRNPSNSVLATLRKIPSYFTKVLPRSFMVFILKIPIIRNLMHRTNSLLEMEKWEPFLRCIGRLAEEGILVDKMELKKIFNLLKTFHSST